MTEFEDQLKKAIERGQRINDARQAREKAAQMSADQLRMRHNDLRLGISERIEQSLKFMMNQLPGFEYENIYGNRGWGGAVSRDELVMRDGQRNNAYSRLELTVKALSELNIVDIGGKGTIKNREVLVRQHYRAIEQVDVDEFLEAVDRWVVEFAQMYMAADAR